MSDPKLVESEPYPDRLDEIRGQNDDEALHPEDCARARLALHDELLGGVPDMLRHADALAGHRPVLPLGASGGPGKLRTLLLMLMMMWASIVGVRRRSGGLAEPSSPDETFG